MMMKTLLTFCTLIGLILGTSAQAELTFDRFKLDDNNAFVCAPEKQAKTDLGKPWVWYAPTLSKRHPNTRDEGWMFERLHAKGIAMAGIDVGESMGNPKGRAIFQELYEHMVAKGYSSKPILLGRSRGGLMLYNWAVEHPECVGGIAGIYTVGNLASWPGLKKAAPAYEMTADELKEKLKAHNPVDRIAPLAKAKVPIFHLHGDNDKVVPLEHNAGLLVQRYKKLGGPATLEIIEGGGHDLKRHWFESQTLTDFMIDKALNGTTNASE